ncbi:MAG TPA: hypothetical protein VKH81_22990 [Candidatus Angelobacter sp.]|nr:hypothetical protein [Candidatus Angelobacter sp.]
MAGITEGELLEFLKAIEEGTIPLQPEGCIPQDIYAGNVPYMASNGWRITIFNDCNEWDYVEHVITPDGRSLSFDEIDDLMSVAREYTPDVEVAWSRYGIPGYMRFRCTNCGVDIDAKVLTKGEYLCDQCRGSAPA